MYMYAYLLKTWKHKIIYNQFYEIYLDLKSSTTFKLTKYDFNIQIHHIIHKKTPP